MLCSGRSSTAGGGVTGRAIESAESSEPMDVMDESERSDLVVLKELTELTESRWKSLSVARCNVVCFRVGPSILGCRNGRFTASLNAFRRWSVGGV